MCEKFQLCLTSKFLFCRANVMDVLCGTVLLLHIVTE
jgi:hypothetical protein